MSLTISRRLWLITLFISVALLGLWLVNRHVQARVEADYQLRQQVNGLQQQLLSLRAAEKDFLQHRKLDYRDQFESLYSDFLSRHDQLMRDVADSGLDTGILQQVRNDFDQYADAFRTVVDHQLRVGLDAEQGLYKALRDAAHQVENVVRSDATLLASLLMLRRHEKDFMLRRDATYYTRFGAALSDFRGALFMSEIDNVTKAQLQNALRDYSDSFSHLVQQEVDIGLDDQSGLIGAMRQQVSTAENTFTKALALVEEKIAHDLAIARQSLSLVIAVIVASSLLVLLYTRAGIVRQLGRAVVYADTLTRGDWHQPVAVSGKDEAAQLLAALESLRVELLRKAHHIEQDSRHKTRLAELSRVLQGVRTTAELGSDALQHLVNALGAQVGALYLAEDDTRLVLCAGHALSRDQALPESYAFGDSLIGQVALTREASVIRNVPGDFLRISSGSGSATPASLLIAPLLWNNQVYGVIEIGALQQLDDDALVFLRDGGEMLAIALHAARAREAIEGMLTQSRAQTAELEAQQAAMHAANDQLAMQAEQLQQSEEELRVQQEELQAQQEELRVLNEELESQSQLQRTRLRELEQRNAELERRLKTAPAL